MKKILIADDEASLRYLIRETLKITGNYELFEAEDGTQALETALANEPDLLILDVKMPGMSGLEVANQYLASGKKGIIMMLTAEDKLRDKDDGVLNGSNYYVTKPFAPLDLLNQIESILADE